MNYLNKLLVVLFFTTSLTFSCNKSSEQTEDENSTEEVVAENETKKSDKPSKPASKPKPKPQPKPVQFAVQKGTKITARPLKAVSTDEVNTGDVVKMKIENSIVVNNNTVIPRGAVANAKVVLAQKQKTMGGRSKLQLELTSIIVEGKTYGFSTDVFAIESKSNTGKTAAKAGGGAAAGAGIGAIAAKKGNKGKGAGIGAAVGAAVGVGAAALQKKEPAIIDEAVSFKTQETTQVTITVAP